MFEITLPPLCVVSAILALSAFFCQANDGTSLTINGDEIINQIGTARYSASASNGEVTNCRWSTSDLNFSGPGPFVTPDGNQCEITYRSFGSLTLKCDADVILNGTTKSVSSSKNISCQQPATNTNVTLSINGPGEVTINSTKTYTANYTGYDGVPTISWRYIGGTPTGNSINIHFVTNITHHLECTLHYKDASNNNQEVTAEMYIKVLPQVELSALRADYKDYTSAVISGTNLVYIHFNIDDDDESADDDTRGTDCEQKEFANGKTDDDLCKVQLSLGEGIQPEDLTDGTLYFEVRNGLRLWTSPNRTEILLENTGTNILRKGFSFANSDKTNVILKILNEGFYIEGMLSGRHLLKISFAANELNLPYFCCSVGGITDQPTGKKRKYYKETTSCNFKNLVGCEWCIKNLPTSSHLDTYNCIAYAIDPQREVFRGTNSYAKPYEGAFWVFLNESDDNSLQGFDSWSENNWRADPFLYVVSFETNKFFSELNYKFRDGFLDPLTTQYFVAFRLPTGECRVFGGGYSLIFKNLLSAVLKEQPNLMKFEKRYTTMAIFNRGSSNPDVVDHFFKMPDFATKVNNNHPLQFCNTNDANRVIMYYTNYHAARSLANTPECSDFDDNIDPSWEMSASKCGGAEELLIHRERQLTFPYGLINKAYK